MSGRKSEKNKYRIFFENKQARKSYEKYTSRSSPKIREQINKEIKKIEENPYIAGAPLSGDLGGLWSSRTGDFRIIYEILQEEKQVNIINLGPRGNIYKKIKLKLIF
ncbi:MAG: type II toxin-antitoxin system RelE/ParE family toxin [Acidobacteriota bacterium]